MFRKILQRFMARSPVASKPGAAVSRLGRLILKETHSSTQMAATPAEAAGYLLE
jgi:hypothetical protein